MATSVSTPAEPINRGRSGRIRVCKPFDNSKNLTNQDKSKRNPTSPQKIVNPMCGFRTFRTSGSRCSVAKWWLGVIMRMAERGRRGQWGRTFPAATRRSA